jgi:hypothetical protein
MLDADFFARSQAKYRRLLSGGPEPPEPQPESREPVVEVASGSAAAEPPQATAELVVEERIVRLADVAAPGRRPALKDPPAALHCVASEEELGRYSLEALKKLAKASSLELPKQASKAAVLAALTDVFRSQQAQQQQQQQQASAQRRQPDAEASAALR